MSLSEQEKLQRQVDKLQKQLEQEKEVKQNQKEYERDLKKAVEMDCISTMSRVFERDGVKNAYINLRLKSTRDEILKHVAENEIELQYLDNNYEKILEKVKKRFVNDEKAKQEYIANQLLSEVKQQQEKQITDNKIDTILSVIGKFIIAVFSCAIWLILLFFICAPICIVLIIGIIIAYIYAIYKTVENYN